MTDSFRVQQIDHVEVFVPERYEAAVWYRDILGLHILTEHEHWAVEGGPLMISSDGGNTMVALFDGESNGFRPAVGHRRVAFRVDGPDFMRFLARSENRVFDEQGQVISFLSPVDHQKSYSVYFCDPYGNRYEVTTYDYIQVHQQLNGGA